MNLSNKISLSGEKHNELEEAKIVLSQKYKGIKYESGCFFWRGYKFDYFRSGISIGGGPDGYMLVDPRNRNNWLFDFGDKEERWKDHISRRGRLERFMNWIRGII